MFDTTSASRIQAANASNANSHASGEDFVVSDLAKRIAAAIGAVVIGKHEAIELLLVCLFTEGHALIEDVPGVGKTTLARTMARTIGADFRRIQFTPDLLPSDISGITYFDQRASEFRFRPGPIFSNIVLADEINRATPRTQSALLEAMEERTVTVEGDTMSLARPFLVLATENPIELEGTFPLPEAQIDRFLVRVTLGYPSKDEENEILHRHRLASSIEKVAEAATTVDVLRAIEIVSAIHADRDVVDYVTSIVRATRAHEAVALGGSPRASLALMRSGRALAAIRGRPFVTPDDIKWLVRPVLSHRILLSPHARLRGRDIDAVLKEVVDSVPVPVEGMVGIAPDQRN